MLAHSMFPHLAWAMWHRGSSTILNQDAEHEPKLSRNCCVSLERSVGFRGLHFSVLWSEEVGGNQYPTPLPPTLQPHPLSCFPWRGNVYYCTWVSWEETLTFSRYMPVSLKNTCHPQKSTSCFFFFFNRMIYDIFYWSEDCQSYWWVSFDWRKIMFKRCRFVPSVLVVEMEILKAFSCVVTCEFFHSSKYNVQKKALCNMK